MNARFKRHNTSLFLILSTIVFFVISFANEVKADNNGQLLNKPLIIKGENYFPPYEFINEQGKPDGFNIDIINAVMKEMKLSYELSLAPWAQVVDQLRHGEIDLVTGMMYTNERAKEFKFGAIHNLIFLNVIFRKGETPANGLASLKNKQIIALKEDITHKILKNEGFDREIVLVDNIGDGLVMLSEGKYDYAVGNLEMARAVIRQKKLDNLDMVDLNMPPREYCFVGRNDSLLNAIEHVFYELKRDGTYDRIYNKWFNQKPDFHIPVFIYFILAVLIFSAVTFIVFIRLLRVQVKKTSRDLEMESQKLALALSADNMEVWGYDVCNDHLYDIRGRIFPPGGMNRVDALELIHPDDRDSFTKVFDKVIAGEIPDKTYCLRFRNNNGQGWQYIEKKFAIIRSPNGAVETIIGTHKNVTAKVLKQKEDEQLLKKYSTVFNSALVGLEYYNKDGILVDLNDVDCQIFGVKDKKALLDAGACIYDNPNLKDIVCREKNIESFKSIIEYDFEKLSRTDYYRFTSKSGQYSIETCIEPIYAADGILDCIIVMTNDVTKPQKLYKMSYESRRKMEHAVKSANIVFWEFNCQTQMFKSYNEPINGYDENCLLGFEDYHQFFHPDDMEKALECMNHMLGGKEYSYSIDMRVRIPDTNDWHFCTINSAPFERDLQTGKVTKYVGIRRDNTDLIRVQLNLEKEKEKALQADKLKSAFLANMSHEIRTPLNAIVGFSNLLYDLENADERAEFVQIINTNSELLLRLINDILDLSKIESGIMEWCREEFDMASFFDDFAVSLRQRVTNPNVEFIVISPYESCIICVDRNRLAQVYTNFATNAIKYTTKGYVKIGYSYVNAGIRVYVEDTGIGIPASKHDRIFRRFEKLDDFAQGTGLGLSICKAIIDSCKGEIGFTSEEGRGSTFWAWIPCVAKFKYRDEPED